MRNAIQCDIERISASVSPARSPLAMWFMAELGRWCLEELEDTQSDVLKCTGCAQQTSSLLTATYLCWTSLSPEGKLQICQFETWPIYFFYQSSEFLISRMRAKLWFKLANHLAKALTLRRYSTNRNFLFLLLKRNQAYWWYGKWLQIQSHYQTDSLTPVYLSQIKFLHICGKMKNDV